MTPWGQLRPVLHWERGQFHCGISVIPPGYLIGEEWFSRSVPDFDFQLIFEGRAELRLEGGEVLDLQRGSAFWLRPGLHCQLQAGATHSLTTAYCHFDLVDRASGRLLAPGEVEVPHWLGEMTQIFHMEATMRRIVELSGEYQLATGREERVGIERQAEHLLCGLLYEYERAVIRRETLARRGVSRQQQEAVLRAVAALHLQPQPPVHPHELARQLGYSPAHLRRLFHRVVGKSPARVIIEARIDHARRLLRTTSLTISEIAGALGYENVFYFSRQFREQVGRTPSAYRDELERKV